MHQEEKLHLSVSWNSAVEIIENETLQLGCVSSPDSHVLLVCVVHSNIGEHTESDLAVKQVTTLSATKRPQGRGWQSTPDRREREVVK